MAGTVRLREDTPVGLGTPRSAEKKQRKVKDLPRRAEVGLYFETAVRSFLSIPIHFSSSIHYPLSTPHQLLFTSI